MVESKLKKLFCLKISLLGLVFLIGMSFALGILASYSLYRYDIIYHKSKDKEYPYNLEQNDAIFFLTFNKYQKLSLNSTILFGVLTLVLLIIAVINYRKC